VQITERDLTLLAFAAEHRFVIAAQVAVLLSATEAAADARLRALGKGGYLRSERKLFRQPASHQITRDGLRAAASDLPVPHPVDLAVYRHDLGLGWLMLAARRGRFGSMADVVSERRMRSHDGRDPARSERFGVRRGGVGADGRERLHYPDMVAVTASGHRVAFELELSTKTRDRREGILAAYGADRDVDAVVYLVERAAVGRAIQRSAARVGVQDRVHVQKVSFGGSPPAPSAARAAERVLRRGSGRGDDAVLRGAGRGDDAVLRGSGSAR
jgi:hypothetical protein